MLFVPGNRQRLLQRAASAGADVIIVDLEDAVPASEKRDARKLVRTMLPSLAASGCSVFVRVNNVGTKLTRSDLLEIVRPGLAGVMHPKSEHPQNLRDLDVLLREAEVRNKVRPGDIAVIPLIETPKGVLRCDDIARSIDRIVALAFGGEDYATAMGVPRSGDAFAYARGVVVTVAAAHGFEAIDTPYPGIDDERGLMREALVAAAMGFRGKLVIHPGQVAAVHKAFTPSRDAIAEARRILEAARVAEKQRKGVVALEGKMIDAPVVERARRVLALAERVGA
jgi:citrate lyase subunit beta/citryl-CoA lyase